MQIMQAVIRQSRRRSSIFGFIWAVAFFLAAASVTLAAGPKLVLKKGDRISIIGNTLADLMQHDGWLETYLYSRFPELDLVFRNLGYAGDELTLRLRSRNFGSPDDWLRKTKADVVFAFFGYNESFADRQGLPKFRQDLENFIKHTLSQKYNGKTPPRLVLFSPIAHEDLRNPHLPDGRENNRRLALYTAAMAEVAKQHNVPFVDLFHPTKKLYRESGQPLTLNGVHMTPYGNEQLAKIIDKALFPEPPKKTRTTEWMEKIREAVLERNFYWFNRYRTVDGYSIYGGRADLRFVDGQTNRVVMQREMEILDVMTANRDRRIWAVARGGDLKVDDSNTPPFIPVKTNRPGKGPGGKHLFLDGETAIKKMKVAKNMKVTLFASEKEWPELVNPVQMAFDTKGRLWVAAWPTYPHWKPKSPMNDKLLIFEDLDGDGKADKMKVFADNLHCPTGFEFWNGGVLVAEAPYIMFLKDVDGDDRADIKIRMLAGIDSADTHHTANSFTFDPGGALYFQEGTFHHTQVETPWGPPVRCANAGVFRFEPRTFKFEVYVNYGFANPHGHVFDRWGQDIVIDGTGAVPYHATIFSGQTADFRQRHPRRGMPTVYNRKTRPCPGLEILSSRHFPEEFQGNLLVPNVIGFLGILRYKLVDDGASFKGIEQEPILQSSDPNFRPADIEIGPDGAIYFTDWQNPIIGHMQHNLRDPSRDVTHGRIYKITYTKRPLLKPAKIDGQPIPHLLELLKAPEDRTRYRARIELGERDEKQVLAELKKWMARLDPKDTDYEHHMLEALWLYQNMDVVNEPLLRRMLRSPDFRARAAATRVLCYWRDRVRNPLVLLRRQINDSHPRVRLEAIRAVSFFDGEEALAVALELLSQPQDRYLRYTFNETLATLERRLGSNLNRKNLAAAVLGMLDRGNLDAERQAVLVQTICRHGSGKELAAVWQRVSENKLYPEVRRQALEWLADAARMRRVLPNVSAQQLQQVLQTSLTKDTSLARNAIDLAVAWKVRDLLPVLRDVAKKGEKLEVRIAAIDALAAFGDRDTLASLAHSRDTATRFAAAAALARVDLQAGARAAAQAIADAKAADDIDGLVQSFLERKGGSRQLALALAKVKVPADTAKRILRAMYLLGRNDEELSQVAGKLAGLDASPRPPTPQEVEQIVRIVQTKGDPVRGEQVFRRMDLGCMKCHSINGAGGDIGPDLGPIGQDSPPDYVVRSILDPNQSIKEEYLTKVIATADGRIVTGIVVERNQNRVVLKDATGKLIAIPTADIEAEVKGKSLMPEGITRILTKNELYDLIKFVSELGKPGAFSKPEVPTVLRWRRLRQIPAELREGVPNRDAVREYLLHAPSQAWENLYTRVNGQLPLQELTVGNAAGVHYLQAEVLVRRSGKARVLVDSDVPVQVWLDEELLAGKKPAVVDLVPGRHTITVRIEGRELDGKHLRVRLVPADDSLLRLTVLNGG